MAKKKVKQVPKKDSVDALIQQYSNQKNIFGKKTKPRNQVILLDDKMLQWRQRLIKRSIHFAIAYMIIAGLIGAITVILASSLAAIFILSALTIGLMTSLYLLLTVKERYISSITNSLQIPFFNKIKMLLQEIQSNESTDVLSKVAERKNLAPYKAYILTYLAYKKEDSIDSFIGFLDEIPVRLRANLAKTMKNPFTHLANVLFNTKGIVIKRGDDAQKKTLEQDGLDDTSLQDIASDQPSKKKKKPISVRDAIRELESNEDSRNFLQGEDFRKTAPWYMKLFSDEQLNAMLEMQMSPAQMARWQRKRIANSAIIAAFIAFGVIICDLLSPVIPSLAIAGNPLYILGAVALGFVSYQWKGRQITRSLSSWRFSRRMAFSQFTQILVPYLFLMKAHGGSLTDVFRSVAGRLENPKDRALVIRLVRDMQNNPNSEIPFVRFAQAYTDDPSAVIFMTAVNRTAQTNGNTEVIEDLAERAQAQLLEKVNQIAKVKEGRMTILPTYVTIIGMIINLIMVMSAMLFQMSSALG